MYFIPHIAYQSKRHDHGTDELTLQKPAESSANRVTRSFEIKNPKLCMKIFNIHIFPIHGVSRLNRRLGSKVVRKRLRQICLLRSIRDTFCVDKINRDYKANRTSVWYFPFLVSFPVESALYKHRTWINNFRFGVQWCSQITRKLKKAAKRVFYLVEVRNRWGVTDSPFWF